MYKENRKKIRSMEIGLLVMAAFVLLSSCRGKTEAVLETVETAEAETEPGGSGPDAEKASGSTETVGSPEVSGSAKTFGSAREETNSDVMISSGTVSDVQAYEADTIRVHVCGAVVSPGVYVLPAASRVYAAIEAAGGMVPGAAEDYLNLADLLLDGDKLVVPFLSELSEAQSPDLSRSGQPRIKLPRRSLPAYRNYLLPFSYLHNPLSQISERSEWKIPE